MPRKATAYPLHWPQLSAYVKYDRERGRCQRCGQREGDYRADLPAPLFPRADPGTLPKSHPHLVQLGTAHLDHDETNQAQANLAALCRACHLRHDAADNHERIRDNRVYARTTDPETGKLFDY